MWLQRDFECLISICTEYVVFLTPAYKSHKFNVYIYLQFTASVIKHLCRTRKLPKKH